MNTTVLFDYRHGLQTGALAGARDAVAGVRLEYGAMRGANQVAMLIAQELVGCPVERAPGVRANVQPHARTIVAAGRDQPARRSVNLGLQLDKGIKRQLIGRTKELDLAHGVSQ